MTTSENKTRFKWWKVAAVGVASLSVLGYCSASSFFGLFGIDFEYTGQVLDFDTKEPIEGAYALAVYQKVDLGPTGAARYCVKTKGMMTGKDGKYHFPIDKLDGNSPADVYAIKADYFLLDFVLPPPKVQHAQNKETYSNRHIYLKKQDVAKPEFQYGFWRCERPESTEGIEAAVRYMKIFSDEYAKYGRDSKGLLEMIERMQASAVNQPYKKK